MQKEIFAEMRPFRKALTVLVGSFDVPEVFILSSIALFLTAADTCLWPLLKVAVSQYGVSQLNYQITT